MTIYGGRIFNRGRVERGYLEVSEGRITKVLEDAEPDVRGLIIPRLVNSHTHLGDAAFSARFAEELDRLSGAPLPDRIAALFAPPDGMKHRLLESTEDADIIDGMAGALRTAYRNGQYSMVDFREGGVAGIDLLRSAADTCGKERPEILMMGRPASGGYDRLEIDEVLDRSNGLGLSGMADMEYSTAKSLATHVHARGKLLAIHVSEVERDDIEKVMALRPDLVIHMRHNAPSDLHALNSAEVPIAVCPTSSGRLGDVPDIGSMLDAGCTVLLGSDNAMVSAPDIVQELAFAGAELDLGESHLERLLGASGKGLNRMAIIDFDPGQRADFTVLEGDFEDLRHMVGSGPAEARVVVTPDGERRG